MRVAAIDVGTNTTRLLVAEGAPTGYRELDRRLVFTRLGEGVDSNRRLNEEALSRTVAAVAEFCAVCGEFGVERIRLAGTSALRDAENRSDFLDAVEKIAGVEAQVLSGEEEARLSFMGATADLGFGLYAVIDVGGGSTEFVLGNPEGEVEERISLDIGSVRLTERFLLSDPPATEEILTMEGTIDEALEKVELAVPRIAQAKLVGVAGTITTLGAIFMGLTSYDPGVTHQMRLSREAANVLYRDLAKKSISDRAAIPAMPEGRADVIVAGTSILSRAMARWRFVEVIVSERDILDGLVLELLEKES